MKRKPKLKKWQIVLTILSIGLIAAQAGAYGFKTQPYGRSCLKKGSGAVSRAVRDVLVKSRSGNRRDRSRTEWPMDGSNCPEPDRSI